MGAVYEVRHTSNEKRWALKIMHPELARSAEARERFSREAKVDALIESTFVVGVIDAGVDAATQTPYLVMEFLVGEDLGEYMLRKGRLPAAEVLIYLRQAARALDKAHAKRIVHRDLKPENLFLCRSDEEDDKVKVLDFGIAKLLETVGQASTQSAGTPLYMAPEQTRRGRDIGPWTDVWALGLIAYTLLVGRSYWQAETIGELYGELLSPEGREQPSARAARGGVSLPASFDAWFFRCVHNDPSRRFSTAGEAVAQLGMVLGKSSPTSSTEPMHATTYAAPLSPLVMVQTTNAPVSAAPGPVGTSGTRHAGLQTRRRLMLGGVSLILTVGVASLIFYSKMGQTVPTTQPSAMSSFDGHFPPTAAVPSASVSSVAPLVSEIAALDASPPKPQPRPSATALTAQVESPQHKRQVQSCHAQCAESMMPIDCFNACMK